MKIKGYDMLNVISSGSYTKVYRVLKTTKKTGPKFFAFKRMKLSEEGITIAMVRELHFLATLKHANIVKVEKMFYAKHSFCVVMEMYPHDLEYYIDKLTLPQIHSVTLQIVSVLSHLHDLDIAHRDVKFENFLVKSNGNDLTVFLCDFNLSVQVNEGDQDVSVGTFYYRSPELVEDEPNPFASTELDCWSLGCMIAEMLTRELLFDAQDDEQLAGWHKLYFASIEADGTSPIICHRIDPEFLETDERPQSNLFVTTELSKAMFKLLRPLEDRATMKDIYKLLMGTEFAPEGEKLPHYPNLPVELVTPANGPNLSRFLDCFEDPDDRYLVTVLSEPTRRLYAKFLATGGKDESVGRDVDQETLLYACLDLVAKFFLSDELFGFDDYNFWCGKRMDPYAFELMQVEVMKRVEYRIV